MFYFISYLICKYTHASAISRLKVRGCTSLKSQWRDKDSNPWSFERYIQESRAYPLHHRRSQPWSAISVQIKYTSQKKFRISCVYFIVESTEDVSYMTISDFCENFVLNDTTLIVQNHLIDPKNTTLRWFYVLLISLLPVFEISSELMQSICLITFYTAVPTPKTVKFTKVVTLGKSIL